MIAALFILAQVTMNLASPQQTMDGFGTAQWRGANGTFWGGQWTDAQVDLLYDCSKGICLNILRLGIASSDQPDEITGAAMGVPFMDYAAGFNDSLLLARRVAIRQPNVKVIAEAWSAPAVCKSGASLNGGSFLTSCNSSWSASIVAAVTAFNLSLKDLNVSIYGVGAQNEPDFDTGSAGYPGMTFTPAAMTTWAKVLCPAVHAVSPAPLCMVGDAAQWVNTFSGGSDYVGNCTADGTCLAAVDVWTTHQYGTPIGNVVAPGTLNGKKLYMLEASNKDGVANDTMTGTGGGIAWAIFIHNALVTGKASAWVAWRAVSESGLANDDGLIDFETTSGVGDGAISKRFYTLGNYSKFVKPGMIAFPFTGSPPTNVSISMFKHPATNDIAIPVINNQASTQAITVTLDATSKCRVVTPWVTDATHNLASVSLINVAANAFTYTLTANSVTTFACNGT